MLHLPAPGLSSSLDSAFSSLPFIQPFLSVLVSSFETVLFVLTSVFLVQVMQPSPNLCPGCLPSLVAPFTLLKHYSDHITMLRISRGEQLSREPLGLLSLADRPRLPSTPSTYFAFLANRSPHRLCRLCASPPLPSVQTLLCQAFSPLPLPPPTSAFPAPHLCWSESFLLATRVRLNATFIGELFLFSERPTLFLLHKGEACP